MAMNSADGSLNFKVWLDVRAKAVHGGYDYGTARTLSTVACPLMPETFNLVINMGGNVSLFAAGDATSCPNPKPMKPEHCTKITDKQGGWVAIASTSVKSTLSITKGCSRSYTNTDIRTWALSLTESLTGGFSANGASGTIGITGSQSRTLAHSYSQEFLESTSMTQEMTFEAGTIWQWQWIIQDVCGSSMFMGSNLVSTHGKFDMPCCLPGYFMKPDDVRGKCHAGADGKVYDLCGRSDEAAAILAV